MARVTRFVKAMPREINPARKSASFCGKLMSSRMPRLFNHWEIEGSTGYWAASVLLFFFFFLSFIILVFALAPLDTHIHSFTLFHIYTLERTLQSGYWAFAQLRNNTGERQSPVISSE